MCSKIINLVKASGVSAGNPQEIRRKYTGSPQVILLLAILSLAILPLAILPLAILPQGQESAKVPLWDMILLFFPVSCWWHGCRLRTDNVHAMCRL